MTSTSKVIQITVPYIKDCQLSVDFQPDLYNRQPFTDEEQELKIEKEWERRKALNKSLFNASKFRLHSVHVNDNHLRLNVGLTDYKTYIGTNFMMPTQRNTRTLTLGNVIILITKENEVPFILRSKNSADNPLTLALPGGHPEPDQMKNNDNLISIFEKGAMDEVYEELFLDTDTEIHLMFMGIVQRIPDEKPSMVYLTNPSKHLSKSDIERNYRKGNQRNKDESIDLIWGGVSCLNHLANDDNNGKFNGYQCVPETVGAAKLWAQMNKDMS